MRLEKKQNVDFVYLTIKSMYEQSRKWKDSLPFKTIMQKVNDSRRSKQQLPMGRRKLYRCLDDLLEDKRVFRRGKGAYTIDYAIEQHEKEKDAFKKTLLSVDDCRKIKGEERRVIGGEKVDIPRNPIFTAPETENISRYIEKWRLKTHGHKDIARAEAWAWINSFILSISCKTETGEADLKIRPEKLVTVGAKTGVDAFIFRKAMEIILELLESLDFERLKKDDNSLLQDAKLSVTINFTPADFFQILKNFRDQAEVDLNSKRVRIPNKPGVVQVMLNESLEKRVFNELFKDQPNALVTESTPIRYRPHSIPDDIPKEIKILWEAIINSRDENKN